MLNAICIQHFLFVVILRCISLGKERFDVLGTSPDEIAEIYFDIV